MSMIFNDYIELANFVLSHYPYEKILTYTKDMHYPWKFVETREGKKRWIVKYPSKNDIKKVLVLQLSYLCSNDMCMGVIKDTENNKRVASLYPAYQFIRLPERNHISVKFIKDRTQIRIAYNYSFYGRFRNYRLPDTRYRWGNKRTLVKFKFSSFDKII